MKGIEVYSAGGGIVIAEKEITPTRCAVVSNEAPEVLSVYNLLGAEVPFLPEDMLLSENVANLDAEHQALHAELLKALNG